MPRLSPLRVSVVVRLAEELRYAPRAALVRDIERIEELALDVDSGGTYPSAWIVFRVTGYRPEVESGTETVEGRALLGDLSALSEHLGSAAMLTIEECPGAIVVEALMARWKMSRKTLDRLRREGLVARRVVEAGQKARARLVFMPQVVESFERSHGERVVRAGRFSRVGTSARARFGARVSAYERRLGWTRGRAVSRVAERAGVSDEAVRVALGGRRVRLDATRVGGAAWRAWRLGLDLESFRRRHDLSARSLRHAMLAWKSSRLRRLLDRGELDGPVSPVFEREDAGEVLLGSPMVTLGVSEIDDGDLAALIGWARGLGAVVGAEERARLAAFQFLREQARWRVVELGEATGTAGAIDEIETLLRGASRMLASVLKAQWRTLLGAIETRVGAPIETLGASGAAEVALMAARAAGRAASVHDPFGRGRLAAAVALGVDREVATWLARRSARDARNGPRTGGGSGRAAMRLPEGARVLDWTREMGAWCGWTELGRRVERRVIEAWGNEEVGGGARNGAVGLLVRQFGLGGAMPMGLGAAARDMGMTENAAARMWLRGPSEVMGARGA